MPIKDDHIGGSPLGSRGSWRRRPQPLRHTLRVVLSAACLGVYGLGCPPTATAAGHVVNLKVQSLQSAAGENGYNVLAPWARRPHTGSSAWLRLRAPVRTSVRHDWGGHAVYAAEFYNDVVECYDASEFNPLPYGTIEGLSHPQGMDSRGSEITVANTGARNILVFHGCASQPTRTMQDLSGYPVDVAIDSRGATYVTNIYDLNGGGEVRKYSRKDPVGVQIGDPNLIKDYFIAVDPGGDVFVDGFAPGNIPEVDWLPAGSNVWQNTGIYVNFPGGLGVDKAGNLLVDDQNGGYLTAYAPPSFLATGVSFACPGPGCSSFRFDKPGSGLWIAGFGIGALWGVRYPGGYLQNEMLQGLIGTPATGVAVTPR